MVGSSRPKMLRSDCGACFAFARNSPVDAEALASDMTAKVMTEKVVKAGGHEQHGA